MKFAYKKILNELKSNPCVDCDETFDPVCMDFDHRPGEIKLGAISKFVSDEKGFYAEIAKCDLVCACCHRLRTKQRGFSEAHKRALRKPKPPSFAEKLRKLRVGQKLTDDIRSRMISEGKHIGRPKSEQIEILCDGCGKLFQLGINDRRRKNKRVYCDLTCYKANKNA